MHISILRSAIACSLLFMAGRALAVAAPSADEAELKRLSVEWMQAIESKDAKTLDKIVAGDYVLQMPGDFVSDYVRRDEWMRNAIGKDWSRFRYENLRVQLNGDHADVTSRLYFHLSPIPIELDSRVIDSWQKRDGQWQVNRRYLGQSNAGDRLKLISGFLAALLVSAVGFGVVRLARRIRPRVTD